jgi:hypothetical protein
LFDRDHSVEQVWAALELVADKPQPLEGVEGHEVEATAPIHEGLGESSHPDQLINYEGKPPRLWDAFRVVRPVKSDQRFEPMQVLQDRRAYGVDCSVGMFDLMP